MNYGVVSANVTIFFDMTNNQYWERLEQVIRWANMTANSFGRHIGLARSESLYQIKAGRFGISHNLARRITEKFPEISSGWLLSGEGTMLNDSNPVQTIPYYDLDISACRSLGSELLRPSSMLHLPVVEQCDCAFRSFDVAINAEIMAGSIVFLQKIDAKAIIPGRYYVIVAPNYVLLRKVRFASESHTELLLEATENDPNAISIAEKKIESVYRVVANLKIY